MPRRDGSAHAAPCGRAVRPSCGQRLVAAPPAREGKAADRDPPHGFPPLRPTNVPPSHTAWRGSRRG
eukprot:scaffold15810_cov117-Isochrysis_galbana.AAC.2